MIFVLLPGSLSLTENERKNQKKYIAAKQRKKGLKRKKRRSRTLDVFYKCKRTHLFT